MLKIGSDGAKESGGLYEETADLPDDVKRNIETELNTNLKNDSNIITTDPVTPQPLEGRKNSNIQQSAPKKIHIEKVNLNRRSHDCSDGSDSMKFKRAKLEAKELTDMNVTKTQENGLVVDKSDIEISDVGKQDSSDADISSDASDSSTKERVKILSPKELNKHRNLKGCIPHYGPKLAEPDGSRTQDDQLNKMRLNQNKILKEERVAKHGSLSIGVWHPGKQLIELVTVKGKYWQTMGYTIRGKKYLYPEEGIYLVEMGALELYGNSLPLSLQQCYDFLLPSEAALDEYQVFSHLMRLGYIVTRHRHSDITEYEHRIKLYHHRSIQQKLAYKKVQGWMDQISTQPEHTPSIMDSVEMTTAKRTPPHTDTDSLGARSNKRLKLSCDKVKGWMNQMGVENVNVDNSELTDESYQSSGNGFSVKSAGDLNRKVAHKREKREAEMKKKMEKGDGSISGGSRGSSKGDVSDASQDSLKGDVSDGSQNSLKGDVFDSSRGSLDSLDCENQDINDDDESSYYSDGPVKPPESFFSVSLLDFYNQEIEPKKNKNRSNGDVSSSMLTSLSSTEGIAPFKLPSETRITTALLAKKLKKTEDSVRSAKDSKNEMLVPALSDIVSGKEGMQPDLDRVEKLIDCVEDTKLEHRKLQKLISDKKNYLIETSCNFLKQGKPSFFGFEKDLNEYNSKLQSSDLGTSDHSTSSSSLDIDEFLDTLVNQLDEGKKSRKKAYKDKPLYSSWDFTQTVIPDIYLSQQDTPMKYTKTKELTKKPCTPIKIKSKTKAKVMQGDKSIVSKKVDGTAKEPSNWGEYKSRRDLAPVQSLQDIVNSPVGHLWKKKVKPLMRPSEAITKEEVFKHLNIIPSFGPGFSCLSMDFSSASQVRISYDVFHPDANFKKSAPGKPAFSLVVYGINKTLPSLAMQMELLRQSGSVSLLFAIVDNADISFYAVKDVMLSPDLGVD